MMREGARFDTETFEGIIGKKETSRETFEGVVGKKETSRETFVGSFVGGLVGYEWPRWVALGLP